MVFELKKRQWHTLWKPCLCHSVSVILDFEIQNLFSWDQLFKFLLKVATQFVITKIYEIKTQEEYLQTQQDHLIYVQITHDSCVKTLEAHECHNSCSKYMSPKGTNQATLFVLRDGGAPKKGQKYKSVAKKCLLLRLGMRWDEVTGRAKKGDKKASASSWGRWCSIIIVLSFDPFVLFDHRESLEVFGRK